MQSLPIGIQTFEKLREMDLLYVDKTQYLYRLIQNGSTYFLSRPRRFGKSLTISTLDAIFRGKKDLFKGLWIYDSDYEWEPYPVIRLDMTLLAEFTGALLERCAKKMLNDIAHQYGISIDTSYPAKMVFESLIMQLYAKHGKVVILVDEYDKPMLDHITNENKTRLNRDFLKGFYGVMKALDDKIRFIFLTGVTKFSQVSVFSGLNNLKDMSMDTRYATMLGYTQDEIEKNFTQHLHLFSKKHGMSQRTILDEIRLWYNGFRFSKDNVTVYNPFSTLLLFDQQDFRNYWFETATPTFLINLIKKQEYNLFAAEQEQVTENAFSTFEIGNLDILALLFQTGYFTIKHYDVRRKLYYLGYPNKEVEIAFTKDVLGVFTDKTKARVDNELVGLETALEKKNLASFFEKLRAFIADIPYTIRKAKDEEQEYQLILYAILRCLGIHVGVEITTNRGRIDAVIHVINTVYVCEFKLHGTEQEALAQIKKKGYYEKYQTKGKKIICVGVAIDRENKNIGKFVSEKIK